MYVYKNTGEQTSEIMSNHAVLLTRLIRRRTYDGGSIVHGFEVRHSGAWARVAGRTVHQGRGPDVTFSDRGWQVVGVRVVAKVATKVICTGSGALWREEV